MAHTLLSTKSRRHYGPLALVQLFRRQVAAAAQAQSGLPGKQIRKRRWRKKRKP